jgi:prepilin-type N-terminal cleavage/methylation domain-containing protein/prepilin-type processing-associated H-X9-DG protein
MKKKGFTLVELLVVIAIIAMLLAILMPALNRVRQLANRLVCSTNLSGIGKAMLAYTTDYHEEFPYIQSTGGGTASTWGAQLQGMDWDVLPANVTTGLQALTKTPVTSALYLLVKYSDVSPGAFVCKASSQQKFELTTNSADSTKQNYSSRIQNAIQAWDFGSSTATGCGPGYKGPWDYCSYSFQQPFRVTASTGSNGGTPKGLRASNTSMPSLAMMADASPWFVRGQLATADSTNGPYLLVAGDWNSDSGEVNKEKVKLANSTNHGKDGQNVLYGDGHVSFETTPLCGIEKDNIYTAWTQNISDPPQPYEKGGGVKPTGPESASYLSGMSQNDDDSFLAN